MKLVHKESWQLYYCENGHVSASIVFKFALLVLAGDSFAVWPDGDDFQHHGGLCKTAAYPNISWSLVHG